MNEYMNILGNIEGNPTECVIRISTNDKVITGGDSLSSVLKELNAQVLSFNFVSFFVPLYATPVTRIQTHTPLHKHTLAYT